MIPPVFPVDHLKGKNATHNIFGIWIRKDLKYYDAILAQEKYEWWFLRRWGLILGTPFIAAAIGCWSLYQSTGQDAWIMPMVLCSIIAIGLQGKIMAAITPLKRRMEIMSHTIEWLVAVRMGANPTGYLEREAKQMLRYDYFKGWTADEIMAAMEKVEAKARKYV